MRIIGQPLSMLKAYKIFQGINSKLAISDNDKDMILIKSVYEFGAKHGYLASIDAFGISKSTYYNYCNIYKSSIRYSTVYSFKSRRPKTLRSKAWDKNMLKYICHLRKLHPNLGKTKLKPYLGSLHLGQKSSLSFC